MVEKYYMLVVVSLILYWFVGYSFLMDKLKFYLVFNVKIKIYVFVYFIINMFICYGDFVVIVILCILDWYIRCNVFNIVIKL